MSGHRLVTHSGLKRLSGDMGKFHSQHKKCDEPKVRDCHYDATTRLDFIITLLRFCSAAKKRKESRQRKNDKDQQKEINMAVIYPIEKLR